MTAFLDTNVLVYAYDPAVPQKQHRALELIASLGHRDIVLSSQVLSEFYVSVQRLDDPLDEADAAAAVRSLMQLRVVPVDASLVARALDVRTRWQPSYWGSLIVAAAERAGADVIYSEDFADGQVLGEVRVENPFRTL